MLKNPVLLGDLQQKILRHLFECKEKDESVSHISRELDTLQPAVFRSIKSLMSEGYLTKEERHKGGEKPVSLTHKGAAAATLLGITYKELEDEANKYRNKSLSDLQFFLNSIRSPGKQDYLYRMVMEFFLKKDLSEIQNLNGSLVTEFLTEIAPKISAEVTTIFDDTSNVKEFVDKYNLDKNLLKDILEERIRNVESFIHLLHEYERTHPASTTMSLQHSNEEKGAQETIVNFETPEPLEEGEYFEAKIPIDELKQTLKEAEKEGADFISVQINSLGKYELHWGRNVRREHTEITT